MNTKMFYVLPASEVHIGYAAIICQEMEASALARGTGIAKRTPEYIATKMQEGKAVIAIHQDGTWAGFCYIETWSHGSYVANSGLIVNPVFRNEGLAKRIKKSVFELSRLKYPNAKIFGLTTGFAVMKINSELGYEPVPYSELTEDQSFWKGCESCVNFSILQSKSRQNCLCTAMLWNPQDKERERRERIDIKKKVKERFTQMKKKQSLLKRLQLGLTKSFKVSQRITSK